MLCRNHLKVVIQYFISFWKVIKPLFNIPMGGAVCTLKSGSSVMGSSPGRAHCFVFLSMTLFLPGTKAYKWVEAKVMLGRILRLTSMPSKGYRNLIPSRFMLQKQG